MGWFYRHGMLIMIAISLSFSVAVAYVGIKHENRLGNDHDYQRRWWSARLPNDAVIEGCSRIVCHYTIGGRRYVANITNTNNNHFTVTPE